MTDLRVLYLTRREAELLRDGCLLREPTTIELKLKIMRLIIEFRLHAIDISDEQTMLPVAISRFEGRMIADGYGITAPQSRTLIQKIDPLIIAWIDEGTIDDGISLLSLRSEETPVSPAPDSGPVPEPASEPELEPDAALPAHAAGTLPERRERSVFDIEEGNGERLLLPIDGTDALAAELEGDPLFPPEANVFWDYEQPEDGAP